MRDTFYKLKYNMWRELIQLRLARMKKEYPGCKYMRKRYAYIDVYIVHTFISVMPCIAVRGWLDENASAS